MSTINSIAQFAINVRDVSKISINPKLILQKAGITDFFKELSNTSVFFTDADGNKHQFNGIKVNNAEIENIDSDPNFTMSVDIDFQQNSENILYNNVVNVSTLHTIALPYTDILGGISMCLYPDAVNSAGGQDTLYDYHTALLFAER